MICSEVLRIRLVLVVLNCFIYTAFDVVAA